MNSVLAFPSGEPKIMPLYSPPKYRGECRLQSGELNWRRGSYRLWLLASTAWILCWGMSLSIYALRFGQVGNLLTIPVLLLGPPAAMLIFGRASLWTVQSAMEGAEKG